MEGRRVPSVTFKTRVRDERIGGPNPYRWQDVSSDALFSGRRVVLFSLPGAFTPVCSDQQCPSFDEHYEEFRRLGIDEVYCLSVNDAFVMHQWGAHLELVNIQLIPDGSGHFTRRMGMLIRRDDLGLGERTWRYAMVVDDGIVEKWFEEPGIDQPHDGEDPYGVTTPENVLAYLAGAWR